MITIPVVQAFMLGLLRLCSMAAAVYLYKEGHGDAVRLGAAGFAFFAVTGQAIDVLKVARQISSAQTTTSVTLKQPADSPTPVQLTAKTEPAPDPARDNITS